MSRIRTPPFGQNIRYVLVVSSTTTKKNLDLSSYTTSRHLNSLKYVEISTSEILAKNLMLATSHLTMAQWSTGPLAHIYP